MSTAAQYAKALHGLGDDAALVRGALEALKRRGHLRLLPRILAEYEKLELSARRLQMHKHATPESDRTRVLLELYRKLVHTHE